jgi:hypothetical protein
MREVGSAIALGSSVGTGAIKVTRGYKRTRWSS